MTARLGAFAVVALLLGLLALDPSYAPSGYVMVPSLSMARQEVSYSCGAAALRMVLARYQRFWKESDLRKQLGSAYAHGTSHRRIVAFAESQGIPAVAKENTTADALRQAVRRGRPTILALQAWGGGHYAVVAGYRRDKFLFFDPYDGTVHELSERELMRRWHDTDSDEKPVTRLALFFSEPRRAAPIAYERMP